MVATTDFPTAVDYNMVASAILISRNNSKIILSCYIAHLFVIFNISLAHFLNISQIRKNSPNGMKKVNNQKKKHTPHEKNNLTNPSYHNQHHGHI